MTLEEAKVYARKGIKVTHQYFMEDEWMIMKGNKCIFENDTEIMLADYIENKEYMLDDWSLYKELTKAYILIRDYYGDKKTKRSQVPLINHIDEGIEILLQQGADQVTIDAFCLHPLLQSDEAFNSNYTMNFEEVDTAALLLAMEYRRVANSYLSTADITVFVGFTNDKIKQMLYADKVQNEKDFRLYHEGTHPRSKELREYFDEWIKVLLK